MTELALRPATDLLARYAAREVSPVEVTQAVLRRIETHDPAVNAFCLVDAEHALESARRSEARWQRNEPQGRLDGVPVSVKDLLLTAGWPTLRGSRLIEPDDQEWTEDAPAVARLREHGAVLLGKTTTPEFGWKGVTDSPRTGVTGNPHDPSRTAGGSSGGSAAAVALGMGALSVGTDGGGSIRIPAGFCGVVGLKPTYGRVPIYPASPFGTVSHAGPITRTAADAALMLDVLAEPDPRDWNGLPAPATSYGDALTASIEGLRIAFSPALGYVKVDPEVAAAVRAAVEVLAGLGARVDEVDPGFGDPLDAFHVLWFSGAAKVVESYGGDPRIDPGLREIAAEGNEFSAVDFIDASAVRVDLGVRMGRFHQRYDVLATPALPIPAFEAGHEVPPGSGMRRWTEWTPFTYPFNLTQQPALTVPCGRTAAGLPIGLQLVGARHSEALLLRAAHCYQAAAP